MSVIKDFIELFVLAVLLIYITVLFFRRPNKHPLSDKEDFYELKARINYFIAVGSIALFTLGYLGYATIDNLSNKYEQEIKPTRDAIRKDSTTISLERITIKKDSIAMDSMKSESKSIKSTYDQSVKLVGEAHNRIKNLFTNIFIVNNIKLPLIDDGGNIKKDSTYLFSNLKTNNGSLPEFSVPPQVLVTTSTGQSVRIYDVTTRSFTVGNPNSGVSFLELEPIKPNSNATFDIWILSRNNQ